ncbi:MULTISPECIES: hypothetical protein [Streptomyces]|nr:MULTISPECIES: hypothetical protein [Streptomyces]
MTAKQKAERARELTRARAAAADRPAAPLSVLPPPAEPAELATATRRAVTADRRRRRDAVSTPPTPPPLLGEALRARSLFLLPDEDEAPADEPGPEPT